MNKKMCIVLVGAPCSGKSTIGKAVADELCGSTAYISSGDIARKLADKHMNMKKNLEKGMLAPESLMRNAIKNEIFNKVIIVNKDIFILDGFPRFGEQAEWLEDLLEHKFNIEYVLIETPENVLRERAKSRCRYDDNSFERRLKYYNEVTYPELLGRVKSIIYSGYSSNETYVQILLRIIREALGGIEDADDCKA